MELAVSTLFFPAKTFLTGMLCFVSNHCQHVFQILGVCFLIACTEVVLHANDDFTKQVVPFLNSYCIKCHGAVDAKGDLPLHELKAIDLTDDSLEVWEKILERVEAREMPPEEAAQPEDSVRQKIAGLIEKNLKEKVAQSKRNFTTSVTRRLTNFEYENTLRDLLGFKLNLLDRLPKDPVIPYRFNNTASYMRVGPEQINRYLECARIAMDSAIVDPEIPEVHKSKREWKPSGIDRGMGTDEVGVYGNRRHSAAWGMGLKSFPRKGEFRIRVKASGIFPDGVKELPLRLVMGYSLMVNSSTLRMQPVGTIRVTKSPDDAQVFEFRGRMENFPVQPGRVVRGKRQPDSLVITPQNLYDDGTLNDDRNFGNTRNISMPRAVVNWIEFEAPIVDAWPPKHHTQILFDSPLKIENRDEYVRQVLQRFMSRAYRRPALDSEVERFAKVFKLVSPEMKTFEAAIRETLAMVLISPPFLYHTAAGNDKTHQYELASRLSYFLWGSMPDEEILQLASLEKLQEPDVIEKQVNRMLTDPRSSDFVRNFTLQWLSLQKMKTVPINRELFPRFLYYVPRGERAGTEVPYRPTIRDFMIDETVGFVAELIRSNASVMNVVDSEFAVLNQPLAAHYGEKNIHGNHLRRVELKKDSRIGGLLTHGSVLLGNGTGSAPHPIYRAVWLREAILGDDVPPPPAEVPALSDSTGESAEKALTIKDLLAKHRSESSCNACHSKLDPWGIPFEKYNAIGRYQPKVPNEGTRVALFNSKNHVNMDGYEAYLQTINVNEVDSSAKLPNGPNVNGMDKLKAYLIDKRKDDIAENVLRRLLAYALGRKLNTRDRFQVQSILLESEKDNYGMRDMIVAICQSDVFRGTQKEVRVSADDK